MIKCDWCKVTTLILSYFLFFFLDVPLFWNSPLHLYHLSLLYKHISFFNIQTSSLAAASSQEQDKEDEIYSALGNKSAVWKYFGFWRGQMKHLAQQSAHLLLLLGQHQLPEVEVTNYSYSNYHNLVIFDKTLDLYLNLHYSMSSTEIRIVMNTIWVNILTIHFYNNAAR